MCGIIGYIGTKDPKGILLDGLKRLEYRGYDSAGVAIIEKSGVELHRCEGRLQRLEEKLGNRNFSGQVGIGHTRWATHGAPTEINAHPHQVGAITLVHNGIIENYLEHKIELLKAGRTMKSETDSEIVAHLVDQQVGDGKSLVEALFAVLPTLKGSYAFVMISEKEPDLIVGVRNGSPLLVGVGAEENFLASDVQAILHRTNQIIYLNDHEIAICDRNQVDLRSLEGKKLKANVTTIQWTADQVEKSGYRHYMLKEIHEQPVALTNTIEIGINHQKGVIAFPALVDAPEAILKPKKITIVACGTARHAALVGKSYIERFAQIPVDVDYGSEFRYRNPLLDDGTLILTISQSGETADTLAAQRAAKTRGVPTLAICNVRESTLAREADVVLYTNAGPEIGVASTKAFTTQLAVLYMLAIELGYRNGNLSEAFAKELTEELVRLPLHLEKTLQLEPQIEKIAEAHSENDFFFYMGRDLNYPIALEGALKLKEISYRHAEGYPAGELKHGPIALIDKNAAIIVLATSDRPYRNDAGGSFKNLSETIHEKLMSNLQVVKSRGGQIWSIVSERETNSAFTTESKFSLTVPDASWGLNPILLSIPLQLFAYHVALGRGTDVDKPRNLAKSVTVE